MVKVTTVEARENLSDLINKAAYGKERIVFTRRGKELVALVPMDDLELLEEMEDRIDLEEAKKAWAEQGKKPLIPLAKVKKRLGMK
ncbi:MAG TPA: type II toxin-antitoxin system Phd/YefM family antitoxin [bacterium]|nr:type II toxin-antitoxin system Phd/YefM family antitoxin [bacterium]